MESFSSKCITEQNSLTTTARTKGLKAKSFDPKAKAIVPTFTVSVTH